jgi:hypothetical protein
MTSVTALGTVHATCRYGHPHTIRRGALSTDGPWYADVTGGGDGIDCGGSPTGLHAPADGMSEVEQLRAELAKERRNLGSLQALADRCREKDWAHSAEQVRRREQAEAENARLAGVVEERSAALGLALHREEVSKGEHAVTTERLTETRNERDNLRQYGERAMAELEGAEAAIERVKAIVPLCDITFAGGPVRVVRLADINRALAAPESYEDAPTDSK